MREVLSEEEMKYRLTIEELRRFDEFISTTNRVMTCSSNKKDVSVKHQNYEQDSDKAVS